jgi:two-component system, cell cycle response regulator
MGDRWTALVIDEASPERDGLARALREMGAEVLVAGSENEAFAALIDNRLDLVVIALDLPMGGGLNFLTQLRAEGERPVPVVATSRSPGLDVAAALTRGADDFLRHPLDGAELVARCQRLRATYQRFAALEAEVRRLHELSVTDGLTQVANHRFFQERLVEEFRRAQRYDDPLALILADLDHFKGVNDQYGHQVGDEVLRALAELLTAAVRETDFVARYGGEEFAVLLPKTHLGGALTVAERVAAELRARKIGPSQVRITASFGVSSFPSRGINTAEQLLRTADEALYRSKSLGRNRISLYQAGQSASASN